MRLREHTLDIVHVEGAVTDRMRARIPVLMDAFELRYCLRVDVVIVKLLHLFDDVAQRLPRPEIEVLGPFSAWLTVTYSHSFV